MASSRVCCEPTGRRPFVHLRRRQAETESYDQSGATASGGGDHVETCTLMRTISQRSRSQLIQPARVNWAIPDGGKLQVRTLAGGFDDRIYPPHALRLDTVRLDPRGWKGSESGEDGRSSNRDMPFLLASSGVSGWATALEWSGLWFGGISAELDGTTTTLFTVPVEGMVLQPKKGRDTTAGGALCL